ncbi:MAG: FAD-dependent oxidoreductase [Bacteroidetes bacterium]|nr:FAD-dependent oxidoreductase [Bacteroidota bacterium]
MMQLQTSFIMPPLKLGYSDGTGRVTERHRAFYRARSGALGAVTLEPLFLDPGLRELPTQLGISVDEHVDGLRSLVNLIHEQGTKVIAHLNHPGRMANPNIPGNFHVSSTDAACENGGAAPKRMDCTDMDGAIELHVRAAERAQRAGFDMIELQFGHGYLLAQFLSPAVNDRTDEYGGRFEQRARFPLEVFRAVAGAVDLPINVRVSGEEMIPGGIGIEETVQLVMQLRDLGAQAVHVSAGSVCSTPPWFFQHMFVPKGKTWEIAAEIKRRVGLPTIFVGRVHSAEDIDRLRSEFGAEYIAVGRALVADPDFIATYLGKKDGIVRPCLACSEGCLGGVRGGHGLGCVVNPLVGRESAPPVQVERHLRCAVVGGGIAGMEAARTLRMQGHDVVLYEKDELGGQFNAAWYPPKKQSLRELVDYYVRELDARSVRVERKECTAEELRKQRYDAVLLATGAVPVIPPIEGLSTYDFAADLLQRPLPEGENILVIGGGLIGIETANALIERANRVTVVEILDTVAGDMEMLERTLTLQNLAAKHARILTGTRVTRIDGQTVLLEAVQEGTEPDTMVLAGIDRIVLAAGMRSDTRLADSLKDEFPVHLIGDASAVGNAQQAIRQGYEAGMGVSER